MSKKAAVIERVKVAESKAEANRLVSVRVYPTES